MQNVRAKDVMTPDPGTCRPTDSAAIAARVMWDRDCGSVPVVDHEGRPIGMITDRDICMAAYTRGARLDDMVVDTVMTHSAVTCTVGDRLDVVEHAMAMARVRRLPVVDSNGVVCGVLSINDIVRARARRGPKETNGVIETLAVISEPRRHEIENRPAEAE